MLQKGRVTSRLSSMLANSQHRDPAVDGDVVIDAVGSFW